MNTIPSIRSTTAVLGACALALAAGCALVRTAAGIDDPSVRITGVRVADASFEQLDLLFDVAIENPNDVAAMLDSFSYNLMMNDLHVLSGTQATAVALAANRSSTVPVPVQVNFNHLYSLYSTLSDEDEVAYRLRADLNFDLPVMGKVNVPVSRSGVLPMSKEPMISVMDLNVDRVGLKSADVELVLRINNPNTFDILLETMAYEFTVNGTQWGRGSIRERMTVNEKGESILRLPFTLDTAAMGQTFMDIIEGNRRINYRFAGEMTVDTTSSLIRHIYLPFDKVGQLGVHR